MKTELLIQAGRNIAEVSFPAYSHYQGGTCDFMTRDCKTNCVLSSTEWEKKALKLFEDEPTYMLMEQIIDEVAKLEATVIAWFINFWKNKKF